MTKYTVTFDLELYAKTPDRAWERACDLVAAAIKTQQNTGAMTVAIKAIGVPNGVMTGAPHSENAFDGWRLMTSIAEKED